MVIVLPAFIYNFNLPAIIYTILFKTIIAHNKKTRLA